jgi:hypothetical protein
MGGGAPADADDGAWRLKALGCQNYAQNDSGERLRMHPKPREKWNLASRLAVH